MAKLFPSLIITLLTLYAPLTQGTVSNTLTSLPENSVFDIVIIGLGNAGSVLANRLSEDPDLKILVIEGGRDDTRLSPLLPEDAPYPIPNKQTNQWSTLSRGANATVLDLYRRGFTGWEFTPLLRATPTSRSLWYPRASTWGGCTAHNLLIALRGSPEIYNQWDKLLGSPGLWNYNTILPFFKKYENRSQRNALGQLYYNPQLPPGTLGSFDPKIHGDKGPIYLSHGYYEDPVASALYKSAELLGLPTRVDLDYPGTEIGLTAQSNTSFDQFGPDFPKINPYSNIYTFPNSTSYQAAGLAGSPTLLERSMAASGYIYPIQNRPNLTVLSESLVTKIIFNEDKRAVGVEYLEGWNIFSTGRNIATNDAGLGGTPGEARANAERSKRTIGVKKVHACKEVILCGGTYNSPQLLMLSGIGPKSDLEHFKIPVIKDLQGVGKHLKDHEEVALTWRFKQPINPFIYNLKGINNEFLSVMTMVFKSTPQQTVPNFHIHIYPGGFTGVSDLTEALVGGTPELPFSPLITIPGNSPHTAPPEYIYPSPFQRFDPPASITLHATLLLEQIADIRSEGFVKLRSADPTEHPLIVTNYLQNEHDLNAHVIAFRDIVKPFVEGLANPATFFVEKNPQGPPFETVPGGLGYFDDWVTPTRSQFETNGTFDATKYKNFLLQNVWAHHASGTCKMGVPSDPLAVVDARGRVFGVKKLRICDCSIFPIIPNANTATPAFMVSERMAVLIKEDLAQEPVEPLAFNLSYSVQCGKTLKVNKNQGLLAHSCGINAHAKVCTKPQHGTLILKKDGSFTYKSNNSFCAQDSFTYRIQTKQGHSSCATVSITSFRGSCKNSWTEHISQKVKNVAC